MVRIILAHTKVNKYDNLNQIRRDFILSKLPGAHKEKDAVEDDEGQGAPILSFKSQVKL